ncbi:unnamed protein product [Peronospora destructor]|uniref:Uncharacterized protein n=1 Tax=Peronospora destructor TaxID=86335 RepID=A0AAV0SZE3_9STRA|nr:unnamed protein product [Peronospora destructor]
MDLSMILSPAIEEEENGRPRAPAPRESREPGHNWSFDELQCAVSILHDFQQPTIESSAPLQGDLRDVRGVKQARCFAKQTHEYKLDETDDVKLSSLRLDDEAHMTADRKVEEEKQKRRSSAAQRV